MKVIFLVLFNVIFLNILGESYASDQRSREYEEQPLSLPKYLKGFDAEFMACASVLRNQNSTEDQIEEAKRNIEELACSGNSPSFYMLWCLKKGNALLGENEDKAAFVRDFLASPLHIIAMCNVGSQIIEYQKSAPTFFSILQQMIDQDPEKSMLHSKLKLALGVGYIVCDEPNSLGNAWQLIQECGNTNESYSEDFTEDAYMYKAYKLFWRYAQRNNDIQLIDNYVQQTYSNPLMPHINELKAAFMVIFQGTCHIERIKSAYGLNLTCE